MKKIDYTKFSKKELISELIEMKKRKKYGLVWDQERELEDVVAKCKKELPILKEVKGRTIQNNPKKPTHILIEGDNYHALSVLNFTHQHSIDVIYIDPPYNTGAKDWKYNNNYVDNNDMYRHSKWLSMMNNRLTIAKNLLKDDGVLVCAIDENEQAHLGVLLEDLFIGYEIHCITIIHNPRGVQGKNFSYTHEYAYFVFKKGYNLIGNIKRTDPIEEEFKDHGGESERSDAKNCFYPVLVKNNKIIGFGDVPENTYHPNKNIILDDNTIEVWPIDAKGVERKWVFARNSVHKIQDKLYVKEKNNNIIDIWRIKDTQKPRTVWFGKKYDASTYGSKIVNKMITTSFPFPKSLFNVKDCLEIIIKNRKNAIVLDYFAGSGTTGHAVSLLNKEDNGSRQFILCTNNENGIAQDITYPRLKAVINGYGDIESGFEEGIDSNLIYYKTLFVSAKSTDQNKGKITKQLTEIICLKENAFESVYDSDIIKLFKNDKNYLAILLDEQKISEFKEHIQDLDLHINTYIFSLGDDDFSNEFLDLKDKVSVRSIPSAILNVYKRIFR